MIETPLRIVVHQNFAADLEKELAGVPHSLRTMKDETDAEMAALLAETDVFVSGRFKALWRDPEHCELRLVQCPGAGTDGIEFAGLPPGCTVCNVYGHERGVAEQAFMLMLALHKRLFALDAALRRGNWTPQQPYLPEMRGHNLLILGLGHIGQELVRWGRFLDMRITALTRQPTPARARSLGLDSVGRLDELGRYLPDADFVVVAIPAATGTVDLIAAKELRLMKPGACLVNVGRGLVVNEDALYEALRTRQIAGAGLDVWYHYPPLGQDGMPSRRPFQDLDNVIMTPHKPTFETMTYRWQEIALNIQRFMRGEKLHCVVVPD